ncbi:glycosyltransferase family 2 protein [Pontibacter locisalis]|uniref:Glycosyltransferase family 2 protein n=1 Tax=Pontibacter locisalis TaxID=1719035 RepID=A0ABW5IRQ3_9BACT
MKSTPLVSVIIPCYNVSDYVEKAVSSILSQTYTNLEILIVDDASTDDTLLKVKSFKDKRIKILEFQDNTKKIEAVNAALKLSTGDLISFQDADDWSEPERIAKQVSRFAGVEDLGICFTKYRYTGAKPSEPASISVTDEELKDEFLKFGNRSFTHLAPTMCATMMITKAALNDTCGYHPYFTGRVAEDIHWVYRILKRYKGSAVEETLYNIRVREGSLTSLQFTGKNVKAAYSWQLLSKVIYYDIQKGIDVLDPIQFDFMKRVELEACEEALTKSILQINKLKLSYESSTRYKIGKLLLSPFLYLKSLR